MRRTESGLRALLEERANDGAGAEPSPHLDRIVRRGRRTRATRRVLSAGAALAATATATAAVLLTGSITGTGLVRPDERAAVGRQPDSAQVETGPELPETYPIVLGAKRYSIPLLHAERFTTTGVGRTVTFTPTSTDTGFKVVCGDPNAWLVLSGPLKGGERGGTSGRCGNGGGGHHDHLSAPTGWLKGPQKIQVWVFPPDAPVVEVAEQLGRCLRVPAPGPCNEEAAGRALFHKDVRERLSAKVGEQPGTWAVGVYDHPPVGTFATTTSPSPTAGSSESAGSSATTGSAASTGSSATSDLSATSDPTATTRRP
ncbi:hypothetical protein AB0C27_18575 [Nonomuraea sp. NPDC048882]|uniref:hypothetical protein n=1 Tax=Nonomuraea sp. NPDC048882 TaxID=3154347 RepID=UPI0033C6C1C5